MGTIRVQRAGHSPCLVGTFCYIQGYVYGTVILKRHAVKVVALCTNWVINWKTV